MMRLDAVYRTVRTVVKEAGYSQLMVRFPFDLYLFASNIAFLHYMLRNRKNGQNKLVLIILQKFGIFSSKI